MNVDILSRQLSSIEAENPKANIEKGSKMAVFWVVAPDL
jgi:hypothetical protein